MTQTEIVAMIEHILATSRYDVPPSESGLVGRPWSAERVERGVAAVQAALVEPRHVTLRVQCVGSPDVERREAWVVAAADGLLVVYDPAAGEFALADALEEGELVDIGVRGDVVGTFLAS